MLNPLFLLPDAISAIISNRIGWNASLRFQSTKNIEYLLQLFALTSIPQPIRYGIYVLAYRVAIVLSLCRSSWCIQMALEIWHF